MTAVVSFMDKLSQRATLCNVNVHCSLLTNSIFTNNLLDVFRKLSNQALIAFKVLHWKKADLKNLNSAYLLHFSLNCC